MSQVKLLHIVGDSRFGGAGRIILRLGEIAQAEGWHVDILTTDPVFQKAVRQHGLGLVNLDVIRRPIRPVWDLGGLIRLHNFLQRESYRIVHTHTSKGGFVGRLAASLANVPVIIHTAHGFAFHERSPVAARFFYSSLERLAARWCDRIVSVSEFHRRWAVELGICGAQHILAIPNGVPGINSDSGTPPQEVRRNLGSREGDLLILSLSRLAADKGIEYLIEAAAMLPRTGSRFQVIIAGDGPMRGQLEQFSRDLGVADRIRFLGFREDCADLLAACDMVVLPSLREGLSMTLLEAMAAGKPIIASSIGSQVEMASQGDMARLVPPADARAICEAILQFARDPELMVHFGAGAQTLLKSRYTEDRMLNSYRQLYLDLLEVKRPAGANAALTEGRLSRVAKSKQPVNHGYSDLIRPPHKSKGSGL